jgi:hypothetical protein
MSMKHWFLAHQWLGWQPRSKSVPKKTSSTPLIYPSNQPLQLLWKLFTYVLCDFNVLAVMSRIILHISACRHIHDIKTLQ